MSENASNKDVAIALHYDHEGAPRVRAKGRGHVARSIIEIAEENAIPIEEDPFLAEALSQIPLDDEIPEALYRAVAEVMSFLFQQAQSGVK